MCVNYLISNLMLKKAYLEIKLLTNKGKYDTILWKGEKI